MYRIFVLGLIALLGACTTEYVLMDEKDFAQEEVSQEYAVSDEQFYVEDEFVENEGSLISANDVFVVGEGQDFVIYQYKNVRVDEVSPLASMYCADVSLGGSPYLREVSLYHNGFMRATFDCVNLAI